ncbi:MAG: dimethylarginine dimethylaminohydrolase family protein, partial [Pirellulales bacterium]
MVYRDRAILSRFRHKVRRGETEYDERWFRSHGFSICRLPAGLYFEGAGDALFCGELLVAGYRFRSDVRSHQWVAARIGCTVLPLELTDPRYYHLDTCFCPLSDGEAIYYPPAFDRYGRTVLEENIPLLLPVEADEAMRFACNAVVVGRTVVFNTGCSRLERVLADHGYQCRATELDEFVKAGGAAKCLTLRLDGEEASAWATGEGSTAARAGDSVP